MYFIICISLGIFMIKLQLQSNDVDKRVVRLNTS